MKESNDESLATRDAALDEMLLQWHEIGDRSSASVAGWTLDLHGMAEEQARLRARGGWARGEDDFLGVLGLRHEEIRHSRILAWLLDPSAKHGLGVRVLGGVLKHAFPEEELDFETLWEAHPTCEVSREGARIDVLVEAPGLTLVVENKVWAHESPGQCDLYHRLFAEEPGARFIFLTPTGRAPTSATTPDAKAAFGRLGYRDLQVILGQALDATREEVRPFGDHGRSVAEGYHHALKKEFR